VLLGGRHLRFYQIATTMTYEPERIYHKQTSPLMNSEELAMT